MKTRTYRGSRLLASVVSTTLAASLGAPTAVWAQSADATLRGRAAANAEVTAKNIATGAVRRTKAGADGTYVLVGMPPGTYKIDAGAGTEQIVTLTVASTATLDLVAGEPTVAPETTLADITVKSRKLVEMRTSEIGATVSMDQIATVPQLTRNFLEFADTVPGVVFNVDSNGRTSIRGGAQSTNSVNVYIDGVGQKGYVRSGLSGQTDNTQGNPFPQLAIGEYKVITSNYKAEYDQISSAAVTAETRSGTNNFEGEAFVTYTNQSFRAETPGESAAGVKTDSKDTEFGISLGGPIIEDKMHFFVTYEGKRYTTPVTVTATNATPDVIAGLPASALAQLGPATLPFDEHLWFAKLDWSITDVDRMVFDAKLRRETSLGDQAGPGTAASAAIETLNTDNRLALRWQHDGSGWFNELRVTFEDAYFEPQGKNGSVNGAVYTNPLQNNDTILTTNGVDPRATQRKGQKGPAVGDDLTFSHLQWGAGDHTIKTGFKYKVVKLEASDAAANYNPIFYYDVTSAGTSTTPYKAVFASVTPGIDPVARSTDRQLGLYLQDDWQATQKLTLNLGVRYDIEWNGSYLNYQTPQFFLDMLNTPDPGCVPTTPPAAPNPYAALCSPGQTYGQSLAKGGVNPADYVNNGHNRSAYTGEIQPRLGFSYDIMGDQKAVVFGGAGRAYDRDLYDYLQLEQTKAALSEPTINFNVPGHNCSGTNCVAWDPKYLNGVGNLQALLNGAAGEMDLLNNHLKVPFSDQFSLGIRNRIGDWNTSASVSRIISKDGFVFTLGNRRPDGSFWGPVPWGGPAQPWLYPPPGLAGNFIIGNNGIETKTTQVLLSAEKPFSLESRWGATIAYTFTAAKQNRDINEHYAFDEEWISQYPFINSNAAAKHRLVMTGTLALPWDLILGTKLVFATPIPTNTITCYNTAGPAFPTGGQCTAMAFTAPGMGIRTVDLELTKNFKIGDVAKVYVRVDALNVFNTKSFVDYNIFSGSNGLANGATYNANGNISGTPRQFRATFGVKY
jgi:outer membrane receptor protein involved in Fe transport